MKIRTAAFLVVGAAAFSQSAPAAPVWLECSGLDERHWNRTSVNHTLQVMFDEATSFVEFRDGDFGLRSDARAYITPGSVQATAPNFDLHIDRQTGALTYIRHRSCAEEFPNCVRPISDMKGKCVVSARPPKRAF